ncbi:hypothetical protein BDDG_05450 [Blastomyces dermatitidis ATCC 18188]|uniref:Uncharacterized protein n=1 Tax=Ajellomyces dermatitidis (strain ATCC 18188 / CBS 674.68) TaxID=653446 RepID=F2TGZ3_AJEDA|nr:hypothetical protein BDDG_05450 [Blastomyces dermatitidis ATCC 18188]
MERRFKSPAWMFPCHWDPRPNPGQADLELIREQYNIPGLAAARSSDSVVIKDAVGVRKVDDHTDLETTDIFHLVILFTLLGGRLLMVKRILNKDPAGVQGEFFYGNTNYVILGRIIEKFTATVPPGRK